ncbi:MAG: VOC family protein [Acidimicrobiia bacterium]|nr:VOC family protein [Acidimicrobiia bacterium]
MSTIVGTVMIDCNDLDGMVSFWSRLLGLEAKARYPDYVWLDRMSETGPALAFQRVSEPRQGKNRLHLDLVDENLEEIEKRVIKLGGAKIDDRSMGDFHWKVLADPEGNVFCVTTAH